MAQMDATLEQLCQEDPQQLRQVVITFVERAQNVKAADLGLTEAEQIAGLLGIWKCSATGEKLLELSQRSDIEEITEDMEVSILAQP